MRTPSSMLSLMPALREIGAGDERRRVIRNHAFRMQASSRCKERLACFERPPVEVGGRLDRLERVLGAEHERASRVVGRLEDKSDLDSSLRRGGEAGGEICDVVADEGEQDEALGCVGDKGGEHRPC